MIIDIFLLILGKILFIISGFFAAISWAIPVQVVNAIEFFFSKLHNVDIFVPMDTLMLALGVYITFIVFFAGIKIIMWVYHIIRHGGDVDLPGLGAKTGNALDYEHKRREFGREGRNRRSYFGMSRR